VRARRRTRRRTTGLGLLAVLLAAAGIIAAHAVIGTLATVFLLGVISGIKLVLGIARPRVSLRISAGGRAVSRRRP
jgi:hypothetical protein